MNKKQIFLTSVIFTVTFFPVKSNLNQESDNFFDQSMSDFRKELDDLQKTTSKLFSSMLAKNDMGFAQSADFDIYKNEKNGRCGLEISLPGFKKEDINVEIDNNGFINILAKTQDKKVEEKKDKEGKVYVYRSKSFASKMFKRSFKLPKFVDYSDSKSIKTTYENGVLRIDFPLKKVEENNKIKLKIEDKKERKALKAQRNLQEKEVLK